MRNSRRQFLANTGNIIAAGSLAAVLPLLARAQAKPMTVGFLYTGVRQDYGWNQAHVVAARQIAKKIGARHMVIRSEEMNSPDYRRNPVDRCYYCKSELYTKLQAIADKQGYARIVNGINLDDMGDYRPGITAALESNVLSPLRDADLSKEEIRSLSKELGLSTWDKPAMACLSSRVPYNQPITPEKLEMIEQAEDFLISLGFKQVRVRHHDDIARVELAKNDMPRFFEGDISDRVQKRFKEIGFKYIAAERTHWQGPKRSREKPRMWQVELRPEVKKQLKNPELFAKGIGNVYAGATVGMGGVLLMLYFYFVQPENVLLPSWIMVAGLGLAGWGEWQKIKSK